MRFHAATIRLVVAMLATVPLTSVAQVYKCQVGGGTTYQAVPCANAPNAAPHIAAPASSGGPGIGSEASGLNGSLASLKLGIQAAAAEERELQVQYRSASDALRSKLSSAAPDDRARARQALDTVWAPRIRALELRQQQFRQEIVRRCHGGQC
jgi:hypothetical protein